MKYTLMAIAYKRVFSWKKQINNVSNDYGLFQSKYKSVIRRQKLKIITIIIEIILQKKLLTWCTGFQQQMQLLK